jgi:hypothetical protein
VPDLHHLHFEIHPDGGLLVVVEGVVREAEEDAVECRKQGGKQGRRAREGMSIGI